MVAYGTEKPQAYRPRLVDERLQRLLSTFGAVEIRGTKWCGKSWAALAFGESVVHLDDPNVKALAEAGVVSPLRRAGMTKANVRHVLASLEERFGLPSGALMSAKPSFPCLAVYVPQGESITEASLREAARSRGL